jgi:hypothetical protein
MSFGVEAFLSDECLVMGVDSTSVYTKRHLPGPCVSASRCMKRIAYGNALGTRGTERIKVDTFHCNPKTETRDTHVRTLQ